MTRTRIALVSATAAALALLTACDGYGSSSGDAPASPTADGGQGAATTGGSLAVAEVGGLGEVVTASDGRTLYRFDKDTANPPVSHCHGDCAAQWPPLLAGESMPPAAGIDPALLGTATREDGAEQVTLNGWPLYRYAKDSAAGDVKGHGVGGTWFAATPEGKKAASVLPKPSPGDGGGYGY
ncbi:hypothetical protein [Amycolatopsis nigrescens]|uniref:hypothetical protein n=1 Tax=Amycolatopsis nigrescens TaxID=381445 RepID=UPI00037DECB7|nr:hypothetical protein [Amycolatopsis nigrescens]